MVAIYIGHIIGKGVEEGGLNATFLLIARHEAEKSQNLLFVIFKNIIS